MTLHLESWLKRLLKTTAAAVEEIDTVNLSLIRLKLSCGDTLLDTTMEVSGLKNRSVVWQIHDPIPPRAWHIYAESFDEKGKLIHEGTGQLRSSVKQEGRTVEINFVITIRRITETIGKQTHES